MQRPHEAWTPGSPPSVPGRASLSYAQYVGGRVRERLDDASKGGRVVTSVLVIAELFYGAAKSLVEILAHAERNLASL
jgi:hypothetical protein